MKRPLPAGMAPGAGLTPIDHSVVQAITGVIRRPRSTFQDVVSHPRWGVLLCVTTLISVMAGFALMQTAVGRQALVDQWERTAVAFGQAVDDAEYARLEALSDQGAGAYAVLAALLSGPLLTVVVAGILKAVFRSGATFRQVMAIATHAGVVLAVRQVVAAPMSYVRETTSSATSVGSWFWSLDEASPVARFLGSLDLFVLWWAIVLAIGVGVLYHRRARTVAAMFIGVYAAIALLLAIAMAVTGGNA